MEIPNLRNATNFGSKMVQNTIWLLGFTLVHTSQTINKFFSEAHTKYKVRLFHFINMVDLELQSDSGRTLYVHLATNKTLETRSSVKK